MPLSFLRLTAFGKASRPVLRVLLGVVTLLLFALASMGSGPAADAAGPVSGPMRGWVLTQPFGCTGYVLEPALGGCPHFHAGIDLAAPAGAPVIAVMAGVAEVLSPAGPGGGYGVHVLIRHAGDIATMYAHLASAAVQSGAQVAVGAVIGYEGSTGLSSGPHLHFEVRRGGVPVDPTRLFPGWFAGINSPGARGTGPRTEN
jgi:murein DD-endopeptidase MepM/ murein hydrolase activator NlpD